MKQTGLIDQILEAISLDSKLATNKWMLAEAKRLAEDEFGEGPQETFSSSSVVGMLFYLAGHTRPGISYAVSCC